MAEAKVLVLFLLPVLGRGLADVCNMKTHLIHSLDALSLNGKYGLSGEHFMAKIVCYADRANGLNTSAVTKLDGADLNVTFYGTFQHRNDLLCSDGTVDSRNLCGQDCSNFIDADLKDDAMCLFTVLLYFLERGFEAEEEIQQHIQHIFDPSCADAAQHQSYSCPDVH